MAKTPHKILLTTSGTGSRLKDLTKNTNKCLVNIHGKPAITYIIDRYPADSEFYVTLGYLGEQVKEALESLYPERKFNFVWVDKYQGPGSSLGYSMLQAKDILQCPFIFHACDTIVPDEVPVPEENWAAGYKHEDSTQYRTLNIVGDQVVLINDKGAPNFDYVHIGLVGVKDYANFWRHLQDLYSENPNDEALNDTFVINRMMQEGIPFRFIPVSAWHDTGNLESLARTVEALKS